MWVRSDLSKYQDVNVNVANKWVHEFGYLHHSFRYQSSIPQAWFLSSFLVSLYSYENHNIGKFHSSNSVSYYILMVASCLLCVFQYRYR